MVWRFEAGLEKLALLMMLNAITYTVSDVAKLTKSCNNYYYKHAVCLIHEQSRCAQVMRTLCGRA